MDRTEASQRNLKAWSSSSCLVKSVTLTPSVGGGELEVDWLLLLKERLKVSVFQKLGRVLKASITRRYSMPPCHIDASRNRTRDRMCGWLCNKAQHSWGWECYHKSTGRSEYWLWQKKKDIKQRKTTPHTHTHTCSQDPQTCIKYSTVPLELHLMPLCHQKRKCLAAQLLLLSWYPPPVLEKMQLATVIVPPTLAA